MDDTGTFESRPAAGGRRRAHSSEERRRSPAPTVRPRLTGLATAVPPYVMGQHDIAERVRVHFTDASAGMLERLMPIYGNTGIERRHACVPIDWHRTLHGWRERNEAYLEGHPNQERQDSGKGTILIEINDVDDAKNDDAVQVGFYGSLDTLPKDSNGKMRMP